MITQGSGSKIWFVTLSYVSEVLEQSRSQQLLDFPNLDVFGVEISDMRQKVWQKPLRVSVSTLDEDDEAGKAMKAKNTGKVRYITNSISLGWKLGPSGRGHSCHYQ